MTRRAGRRWTVLTVAMALVVGATVPAGADEPTGSISGTVTSAIDSVEGVDVTAYHPDGWNRGTVVEPDGTYTITELPPADYRVRFARWEGELEWQYWPDVLSEDEAVPVTVLAGEAVTGIDADLQRRPAVSGTVTGPDGPVEGILVFIRAGDWRTATTAADGTYRIRNLPIGDHVVCFSDPTGALHPRCFDGVVARSAATPVPVGRGEEAAGVDAALQPVSAPVFSDTAGSPFNQEIAWTSAVGVVNGYADGTFGPDNVVSRQAMAAFLHRLVDPQEFVAPATATFTDVPVDHPFFREIEWLVDAGIATGYADGTFGPSGPVSRQAMAAFLQRVSSEGATPPATGVSFPDVPVGHRFYEEIRWLAGYGVTSGSPFRPSDPVSRGAMAAFLHRLPITLVRWEQVLNRRPNPPIAPRVGASCGSWTASTTPTLFATIVDPDMVGAAARFEVYRVSDGARIWGPVDTTVRSSGALHQATVTGGLLQEGIGYRARITGLDSAGRTGPAATCDFRVDLTPPAAPTVTPVEGAPAYYPEGVWAGGIYQEGWFRPHSASTDVVRYGYSFNNTAITHHVDAADPIITFVPQSTGPVTLRVQAVDRAGWVSPVTTYLILVAAAGSG